MTWFLLVLAGIALDEIVRGFLRARRLFNESLRAVDEITRQRLARGR